ncbi:unnamed protein product [Didymodactylos carnosus]|uniref:Junctophilin n=1 Tax=Didymodactylos carnosus TaxID=1234261 RepID=A0A8S2H178_9BILA|nr:unnamed protein product [Didymodactylos carnosus]CAF3584345.1 unnamed protein product [Didymodactylos carnosus]
MNTGVTGGRFDFDDGGTYCGGWEDGKAHGHGVCTGPKGQGEYSGAWQFGYEVSGIYLWPAGNCYEGQWMSGKRHGLGAEKKGRWIYKGEWTQGFKGRYGIRVSDISGAKYEGTWANGLQDGYGVESYADGGTYHGQITQGLRHGWGIRRSVPYGTASRYRSKDVRDSLTSLRSEEDDERTQRERDKRFDENRGGFVLRAKSDSADRSAPNRRGSLSNSTERRSSLRKVLLSKLRKQKSTSDIEELSTTKKTSSFRSTASTTSGDSKHSVKTAPITSTNDDGDHSFISQEDILDVNVIETYMGEWKADKRTGFGIAERSDGLKYEGEWFNNKKNGYGVTTFRDGTKEEGKYKNNILVTDKRKPNKLFLLRSSKLRDKIDQATNSAVKAAQNAQQKAEIAMSRANNARAKAHSAEIYAKQARADSDIARVCAKNVAPDFRQPGEEKRPAYIPLEIDRNPEAGKFQMVGNHIGGGINGAIINESLLPPNRLSPQTYVDHRYQNMLNNPHGTPSLGPGIILRESESMYQTHPIIPTGPYQSSMLQNNPLQHQQDYYKDSHLTGIKMSPTMYSDHSEQQSGSSVPKRYSALQSSLIDQNSTPGNLSFEDDHASQITTNPSLNFGSARTLPNYSDTGGPSVFNKVEQKRLTLKRSTRVEASTEDMLNPNSSSNNDFRSRGQTPPISSSSVYNPNPQQLYRQPYPQQRYQQQQQQQPQMMMNSPSFPITPSATAYLPGGGANLRGIHSKHHGNRLYHGAIDSQNSSFHDSGTSSGGASFDPELAMHFNKTGMPIISDMNTNSSSIGATHYVNNNHTNDPNQPLSRQSSPIPGTSTVPRRKSLPSIVKNPGYKDNETARSSDNLKNKETFIIENGIRKRVTEQPQKLTDSGNPVPMSNALTSSGSPSLPRKVILESITNINQTSANKRVSMPTLVGEFSRKKPGMTREEVSILSSQRREEIRRQRERTASNIGRLKAMLQTDCVSDSMHAFYTPTQEISIQTDFGESYIDSIQNYFYRNRVILAILFLNLSLALWFIQLLR